MSIVKRNLGAAFSVFAAGALLWACAGQDDKDGDGFFNDDALCGTALFDCDDESRAVTAGLIYYQDCDIDGYGDLTKPVYLCDIEGFECPDPDAFCPVVTNGLDCNDEPELGSTVGAGFPVYPDCDQDSLGDPSRSIIYCTQNGVPAPEPDFNGCPYVTNADDCDDTDGNGIGVETVYWDCDGDGFGSDEFGTMHVCEGAEELPVTEGIKDCPFVNQGGDCNDDPENGGVDINPTTDPDGELCGTADAANKW